MEIVGHKLCECGQLEVTHVFEQLGGVCTRCFSAGKMGPLNRVEVAVRMQLVPVRLQRNRSRSRHRSAAYMGRKKLVDKCQLRAMRRLRLLVRDLYDVVYADERIKAGLAPVPRRDQRTLAEVVETYEAARVYHAAHGPVQRAEQES